MKLTLKEIAAKQFVYLIDSPKLKSCSCLTAQNWEDVRHEILKGLELACGEAVNAVETLRIDGEEVHKVEGDSAFNSQVGGNHYQMPIQHAEFCQKNKLPWCESAAIKYLVRHKRKAGLQDVRKALHYIELMAQMEYGVTPAQLHEKA